MVFASHNSFFIKLFIQLKSNMSVKSNGFLMKADSLISVCNVQGELRVNCISEAGRESASSILAGLMLTTTKASLHISCFAISYIMSYCVM